MRTEYWNGGSIDAQIESLQTILNCCFRMQEELNHDAAIHPRDYNGGFDDKEHTDDVVKWSQSFKHVLAVQHYCEKRMEELFDLRDRHVQSKAAPLPNPPL